MEKAEQREKLTRIMSLLFFFFFKHQKSEYPGKYLHKNIQVKQQLLNDELELQTLVGKRLFKFSLNHVKMKSGFFLKNPKPLDSILCIFTQANQEKFNKKGPQSRKGHV